MYAGDISIIVLATNIAFSNGVLPASIDWSSKHSLSNGDLGKVKKPSLQITHRLIL
jgi:hypothetical protein